MQKKSPSTSSETEAVAPSRAESLLDLLKGIVGNNRHVVSLTVAMRERTKGSDKEDDMDEVDDDIRNLVSNFSGNNGTPAEINLGPDGLLTINFPKAS